jgi:SpoVK/Ycf46/Vps4 family AAA+-type ATPase
MSNKMISNATSQKNTLLISDILGEHRDTNRGIDENGDPLAPLRSLYAAEEIVASLESLQKLIAVRRRDSKEFSVAAGNWLFLGNPGTGKTTVAKCIGRLLNDLGVLPRSHVEVTSAADLMGQFSGEAKRLVSDAMGRAQGGILFIDEAYELGHGQYGQEAMTKLVEMLSLDNYSHGTVVVMAGYEDAMLEMLKLNASLASHFQRTLRFPDWTAENACNFIMEQIRKDAYVVGAGVSAALHSAFEELITRPGWANARDATSAWRDRIQFERAKRVYETEEVIPTVLLEDVQAGMASFLATRPKGLPRRYQDAMKHMQESLRYTLARLMGIPSVLPHDDSTEAISRGTLINSNPPQEQLAEESNYKKAFSLVDQTNLGDVFGDANREGLQHEIKESDHDDSAQLATLRAIEEEARIDEDGAKRTADDTDLFVVSATRADTPQQA